MSNLSFSNSLDRWCRSGIRRSIQVLDKTDQNKMLGRESLSTDVSGESTYKFSREVL